MHIFKVYVFKFDVLTYVYTHETITKSRLNIPITPEIFLMSLGDPSLIPDPQATMEFPVTHFDMMYFHFH